MRRFFAAAASAAVGLALLSGPAALARPSHTPAPQCFLSRDWNGWKATPDSKTIYLRVSTNRIYRLDLTSACPALQSPGAFLVHRTRGSGRICTAVDLNLSVATDRQTRIPCIVGNITPLSHDEADALPRNLRP